MTEKKQIGKILLRQRALRADQLERALAEPGEGRLASRLSAEGTITDIAALKALSEQHGIPGIDLSQLCLRLDQLDLLPREIAERHRMLPVLEHEDRVFVAMADPREKAVLDELEFVTGKRVYPYVALQTALIAVIDEAYSRKARGESYYIGANCPPEVLRKLGLDSAGDALSPADTSPASEFELRPRAPLADPGVIVDDEVVNASRSDDVEDDQFGDVSEGSGAVDPSETLVLEPDPETKTILVVDDEADIRKMLARLLTTRGFRVLEADRGRLALRMVKEHDPDLIVLDAMLPELHGFEIARRIKQSERYGKIPIIMVSAVYRGWRYAEDLKQSCGVDHFIEKPFTIQEVGDAVTACLAQQPSRDLSTEQELSEEAELALQQGIEAYRGQRIEEAIEHLQRGIGIDPLASRLHFHLGLLQGKKGQVFEAIASLEAAVAISGRHFAALKNLAILYQKAGFRNRAVDMWERALRCAADEPTRQNIRQHLLRLL